MTDKKNQADAAQNEFGADFDFDSMDWSGDGAKGGDGAGAASFGEGAFEPGDSFGEDNGFGGAADPKDSDDGFGTSTAFGGTEAFGAPDDSFGSDDGFGDDQFDEMPVPGANPDSTTPGNPDDEFADLGGSDGGFGSGFDPDHEQPDAFSADGDAFADAPAPAAEEDDPFGETAPEPETAAAPAASGQGPSRIGKLIFPVAALAVAGGIGYVAYTTFLTQPAPVPVETPAEVAPPTGTAPASLPPLPAGGNGDLIAGNDLDSLGAPPAAGFPAAPSGTQPSDADGVPAVAPDDDLTGGDRGGLGSGTTPVAALPAPDDAGMPDFGAVPPAAGIPAPLPMPGMPDVADPALPEVGAPAPDAVPALPATADATPAAPSPAEPEEGPTLDDIRSLEDRLAALERRIEELSRTTSQAAPAAPAADVGEAPVPRADLPAPPLKPIIVEGVTLKGVSRDLAWVGTPSGVVEVRAGDTVPGAGKVVRIRPYGGDWILVTEKGLVTR